MGRIILPLPAYILLHVSTLTLGLAVPVLALAGAGQQWAAHYSWELSVASAALATLIGAVVGCRVEPPARFATVKLWPTWARFLTSLVMGFGWAVAASSQLGLGLGIAVSAFAGAFSGPILILLVQGRQVGQFGGSNDAN
jgi:hypothetical protein